MEPQLDLIRQGLDKQGAMLQAHTWCMIRALLACAASLCSTIIALFWQVPGWYFAVGTLAIALGLWQLSLADKILKEALELNRLTGEVIYNPNPSTVEALRRMLSQ